MQKVAWSVPLVALALGACGSPAERHAEPAGAALAVAASPSTRSDSAPAGPDDIRPFPTGLRGQLVFQSDKTGRTQVYLLDLATGEVKALTTGKAWRDESPRWSPDGTRILFRSNRAHYEGPSPEAGEADWDLYLMQADGSNVRRLTRDAGNDYDPSWVPDGKSVVYSSDRDSRGDLYRLWLDDGRVERLTRHFVGRAIMPAVSPDGRTVAFAAQTLRVGEFWNFQVHLLDLATKQSRPLAASGGACWPAWSPDGQRMANVRLDREPSSLEVREMTGDRRAPLLEDAKLWSYYPDFSPDGTAVAFSVSPHHHEGEDWDLAVLKVDEPGRFVRLTSGSGNDRLPDWRPSPR